MPRPWPIEDGVEQRSRRWRKPPACAGPRLVSDEPHSTGTQRPATVLRKLHNGSVWPEESVLVTAQEQVLGGGYLGAGVEHGGSHARRRSPSEPGSRRAIGCSTTSPWSVR